MRQWAKTACRFCSIYSLVSASDPINSEDSPGLSLTTHPHHGFFETGGKYLRAHVLQVFIAFGDLRIGAKNTLGVTDVRQLYVGHVPGGLWFFFFWIKRAPFPGFQQPVEKFFHARHLAPAVT